MPRPARAHHPESPVTRVELPEGRHFAVTWSIPDEFGGMTDAMLRRFFEDTATFMMNRRP